MSSTAPLTGRARIPAKPASNNMRKLAIVALAVSFVSGCSSSPSGGTTPAIATQIAYVRFANVSPDAAVANPSNPQAELALYSTAAAQVLVDGRAVASLAQDSALGATVSALASITPYVPLPTTSHAITFQDPSAFTAQGYLGINGTLPSLKAGSYYTVVLNGSYCNNTLAFSTFTDAPQTSGSLVVYAVAPDSSDASFEFGSFPANSSAGPYAKLGSVSLGTIASASLAGSSNVGAYVMIAGAPQTLVPSALDAYDTANALPFNALSSLVLFIRDGLTTSSRGICPFTPGAAIVQGALTN